MAKKSNKIDLLKDKINSLQEKYEEELKKVNERRIKPIGEMVSKIVKKMAKIELRDMTDEEYKKFMKYLFDYLSKMPINLEDSDSKKIVSILIKKEDKDFEQIKQKLKDNGAKWNNEKYTWDIDLKKAKELGFEARIG